MLSARGRKLLFADADGATKFEDIVKLESVLQELSESNYLKIIILLFRNGYI